MREPMGTNLLPRIGVVACGGTIASTGTSGAATPRLGATDLLDAAPWLAQLARLDARTFMTKASPDVTLDDVTRLCAELLEFQESAGLDGLVVTHGTDTLEEIAFALDLLWPLDVPLIVTGAMRNASMPGADGPANLTAAIAVAGASSARGQGVLVVLNDQVHAARYVRKGHTSSVATFASPTVGPVGYLAEGVPVLPFTLPRPFVLDALPPTPLTARVALLTVGIGDDGGLLPAARVMLMLCDLEEISRGLADGLQYKEIALRVGRDPSVISHEVVHHDGREAVPWLRTRRRAPHASGRTCSRSSGWRSGVRAVRGGWSPLDRGPVADPQSPTTRLAGCLIRQSTRASMPSRCPPWTGS